MSRYTRTPVTSGFEVQSQLNQNFSDIQAAIDDTLSRVSDQPNQMEADIDMNSNRIYNLPTAASVTEPVTLGQFLGTATPATYYGAFNWVSTATASQTLFTGITPAYSPGNGNLTVYINGVRQHPTAYTETSSTSVTFSSGLDAGDEVLFVINEALVDNTVPASLASTTTYQQGSTGSVSRTVTSKLQEFVSVKDFGAVGDGVTDDSAAIQAAIDSLIGKGGMVYFPTGRYYLATPIILQTTHEAITLSGPSMGRGSVAVQAVQLLAATCAIKTATSGSNKPGIDGQLYGFCISNILIMSSTATHDHLLQLNGIYTGNFENILISGVTIGKDNLQLSNAVDVNIDNLQIAGCGRYGVNIGNAVSSNSSTTIRFRGGYLRNCYDAGIWGIGADQMSSLIIDGVIVESSGRDGAGAPILGAVGAGVVVENTTGLEINAYFEGNLSADIILGGTISSGGAVTKGVQCKNSYVDGYFYASTGVGANCKYGVLLVNTDEAEVNGHYSSHSVSEISIDAALIDDVKNINFNRITYGSIPSGTIGDNWNRIDPLVPQSNLRIGGSRATGSTTTGAGVFPAQFDGNGLRLPGNTSTTGMNAGDGFQFFNSTLSSVATWVTDNYYYSQNPRTIIYPATSHSGTLDIGYGKTILRPNGAGQSVAMPVGQYSGQSMTVCNASSVNAITVTGGFSSVNIPAGKAVDLIYDSSSGAWLSKSI